MKKFVVSLVCTGLFFANINMSFATTFSDVSQDAFYYDSVQYLTDIGAVSGYSDGTFGYNLTLNRAEMLKMIVASKNISYINIRPPSKCFNDLSTTAWYYQYVCYAKEFGWVAGYSDGTFKPSQQVTFVEALKMVLEAYNYDVPLSNPWYKSYVETASTFNVIPLTIKSFNLPLKRSEMADLLTRVKKNSLGELADFLGSKADVKVTYSSILDGVDKYKTYLDLISNAPESIQSSELELNTTGIFYDGSILKASVSLTNLLSTDINNKNLKIKMYDSDSDLIGIYTDSDFDIKSDITHSFEAIFTLEGDYKTEKAEGRGYLKAYLGNELVSTSSYIIDNAEYEEPSTSQITVSTPQVSTQPTSCSLDCRTGLVIESVSVWYDAEILKGTVGIINNSNLDIDGANLKVKLWHKLNNSFYFIGTYDYYGFDLVKGGTKRFYSFTFDLEPKYESELASGTVNADVYLNNVSNDTQPVTIDTTNATSAGDGMLSYDFGLFTIKYGEDWNFYLENYETPNQANVLEIYPGRGNLHIKQVATSDFYDYVVDTLGVNDIYYVIVDGHGGYKFNYGDGYGYVIKLNDSYSVFAWGSNYDYFEEYKNVITTMEIDSTF